MNDDVIYAYEPHDRTKMKLDGMTTGPVKVADQLPRGSATARFNAWFAVKVTKGIGTMWCASVRGVDHRQPSLGHQRSQRGRTRVLDLTDLSAVGPAIGDHRRSKRAGRRSRHAIRGHLQRCRRGTP